MVFHGRDLLGWSEREFGTHCVDGIVQGADPVGQARGHRVVPEVEPGLGGPHRLDLQAAVQRHRFGEQAIEPVHLPLKRGTGIVRKRRVGTEIVLVAAGVNGREAIAFPVVPGRLVGVQGDDSDGADPTGAGDEDLIGCGRQGIGGGEGLIVGHRPDRLVAVRRVDAFGQFENTTGLTTGAVDIEHDTGNPGIGHRLLDLSPDRLIAGQPRCRLQRQRATHQGSVNRDHRDAVLFRRRRRLRRRPGCRTLHHRPTDTRPKRGKDRVQLGTVNQQRRVEQPCGDMGQVHG